MWQWFARNWVQGLAREKIRQTVVQAAQEQLAAAVGRPPTEEPLPPPEVGLVFALEQESGGLEDRLAGRTMTRGGGFIFCQGTLEGRPVVLVRSGGGRRAAAKATGLLLDVHRPAWVISAGFAGGLDPALERGDCLLVNEVLDAEGRRLGLDLQADPESLARLKRVHVGRLLTLDRIVASPREKRALGQKHAALAVDMETLAVAEVCRRREARLLAVRIVHDAVDDALPADVGCLIAQRTPAARWGAALGAIVNRPGSVKDLYRLKEQALLSSDRLAKFLVGVIGQLPRGSGE